MGSGSFHHSALLSYYYVAPGHVGFCILAVSVVSWLKNWEPEVRGLSPPTYFITKGQGAGGPDSWFWDDCLPFPLPVTVFTGPVQDRWGAMATRMTLCKTPATRDKDTPRIFPACFSPWMLKKTIPAATFPVHLHSGLSLDAQVRQQELDFDTWNVPHYLQSVSASGAVKTSKVRQAQMFPDTAHDCYLVFKSLLL